MVLSYSVSCGGKRCGISCSVRSCRIKLKGTARELRRFMLGILVLGLIDSHRIEAFGMVSISRVRATGRVPSSFYGYFPVRVSAFEKIEHESTGDPTENAYSDNEEDCEEPSDEDITYWTNLEIGKLANQSPYNASAAISAHRLLDELPRPDSITYNIVLNAYAKSPDKDSAWVAEQLLDQMENEHEYQMLQNQLWHEKHREGRLTQDEIDSGPPQVSVVPNVRSYSTVIDAWSRGRDKESAERAHDLLLRMEDFYQQTGDVANRPNDVSYNTVIAAWAKSGEGREAAMRAQDLLQSMRRLDLDDVISYNAAILAWARSGVPDAGVNAETILRNMTHVLPNTRTYTTVIDAWSRSKDESSARRAHALLKEMEDVYNESGDENVRPNCVTYSAVINAYAHSKEHSKAAMACELLKHMKELYDTGENTKAKPSLVTYNSVLNACATTTRGMEDDDGIDLKNIVRSIYRELTHNEQGLRPDHFTYGTVLKACANLFCGESDNPEFVQEVFEQCCEDGQVSFGVCYQLRQAAPSELYRSLIPPEAYNERNGHFSLKYMPKTWTRNVQERRRGRRSKN